MMACRVTTGRRPPFMGVTVDDETPHSDAWHLGASASDFWSIRNSAESAYPITYPMSVFCPDADASPV
jgi:hypothetical protein